MTTRVHIIVLIVVGLHGVYGGEWRNISGVDNAKYYRVNDLSIPITTKIKLIAKVKQCKEVEVQLMEKDGGSWIYVRIGGGENEWAAMASSTKCDDNGCYWVTYKYGTYLDCNEFRTFYFSWDNRGNIQVGQGEVTGKNVMMDEKLGKVFTINYISVRSKIDTEKGDWLFLKDEPPYFTAPKPDGTEIVDVAESVSIGFDVMTLRGGDPEGDNLTFSLLTHTDVFSVDGSELKTSVLLDYETLSSYVVGVNVFDGRNNVRAFVTIRVTDTIDESPMITTLGPLLILEELSTGTLLAQYFNVSDADTGDTHTYALTATDASFFNIDSTTGEMSVKTRIDREGAGGRTTLDQLRVTVTDSSSKQATLDFALTVVDVNDNPPVFNMSTYVAQVTENSPADTSLGEVAVTDSDDGNNAVFTISIVDGDDTASKFKFVGNTLMTDSTYTDYDTDAMKAKQYTYTLIVTSVDSPDEGHALTGMATYIVNLKPENDNTPSWESPAIDGNNNFEAVTIDEGADPLTSITTFSASDLDHGDDGVVTYTIISATSDGGSDGLSKFTLAPTTGELRTAARLDADSSTGGVNYYSVIVKAADTGGLSATGTIKVQVGQVNDNTPVFSQSQYVVSVSETTAASTSLLTLVATDDDPGTTIAYSIEGDDSAEFQMSGDILQLKTALDFETKTGYVFTARASDGTLDSTTVVVVQVTDASDEQLAINLADPLVIREEQPADTVLYGVYTLTYQAAFTFSLTGTGADEYLNINSSTGAISLKTKIDRDDPNTGLRTLDKVRLTVDDGAGASVSADLVFTIEDINDNVPSVEKSVYRVDVTENTDSELLLINFDVVDKDDGNNAKIQVNITDGDDADPKFSMDGMRLVADASKIDYDAMSDGVDVYTLTVSVQDTPDTGSALATAVLVIVTIVPKNEFTPVWVSPKFVNNSFPSVVLRETVLPATEVTVFSASDQDRGADGVIQYKIETIKEHFKNTKVKDAKDMFLVISSSGALMTARGLDADTGITHYELVIFAIDSGTEPRTASGTIIVNIQDENDAASGSSDDSAELWVMRVLVGILAVGMLLVTLLFLKTVFTATAVGPVRPPIKKVVPKVQLERPEASVTHFKKGHIGYEISDYDDDLYL